MRTIKLRYVEVDFFDNGEARTRFRDSDLADVEAQPHDTHHYHVIAHRCGYGDDIGRYCQEHEFFHSFCAEYFMDGLSDVLFCLSDGANIPPFTAGLEENFVMTCQRWVRANERPIIGGLNWDLFKAEALRHLDG